MPVDVQSKESLLSEKLLIRLCIWLKCWKNPILGCLPTLTLVLWATLIVHLTTSQCHPPPPGGGLPGYARDLAIDPIVTRFPALAARLRPQYTQQARYEWRQPRSIMAEDSADDEPAKRPRGTAVEAHFRHNEAVGRRVLAIAVGPDGEEAGPAIPLPGEAGTPGELSGLMETVATCGRFLGGGGGEGRSARPRAAVWNDGAQRGRPSQPGPRAVREAANHRWGYFLEHQSPTPEIFCLCLRRRVALLKKKNL